LRLIAKQIPDEVIAKAKVVAKGMGISLTEAMNDDMVVNFQNKLKEDAKKEKAKLGGSKGSQNAETEQTQFKAGMSDEEHLALWKKSQGL